MDNWDGVCAVLSDILNENAGMNFNIRLSPEQFARYALDKLVFIRINSLTPQNIEAALFVTIDGECGFIATGGSLSTYKYLTAEFKNFVLTLPTEVAQHLWCRTQKDNIVAQRLIKRLGFVQHQATANAIYFKYEGG